jgi:prepilin-type N-terminal cleavage/methylation domain-containing protein
MNNFTKKKSGFSLIEILAVLFIVSVALLGLVSLIVQNIQAQSINKNNLIAYNLAQEGIELIRQTRDSNWKNSLPYDTNLADGTYYMDYRMDKPEIASLSSGKIYLLNVSGYLNYVNLQAGDSGAIPTIFTREIYLDKPVGYEGNPLQVRVLVTWSDRGHAYRYELRTLLFDWK